MIRRQPTPRRWLAIPSALAIALLTGYSASKLPSADAASTNAGRTPVGGGAVVADRDRRPGASLTNTYWRIRSMRSQSVTAVEGRREPHLLLRHLNQRYTYAATAGCNQMSGAFTLDGERIAFAPGPTTRMACPPPLDALEQSLLDMLGQARQWRIAGDVLELKDDAGAPIAVLEAVYF